MIATSSQAALTLTSGWDAVRISLHILAATIWVGGQFVMLGLLPTARGLGSEATKKLAGAFARLSWPATCCRPSAPSEQAARVGRRDWARVLGPASGSARILSN